MLFICWYAAPHDTTTFVCVSISSFSFLPPKTSFAHLQLHFYSMSALLEASAMAPGQYF